MAEENVSRKKVFSEKDLINAIHNGIYNANKLYTNISNGFTIAEDRIESFMVANVANEVIKKEPSYLRLEYNLNNVKKMKKCKPGRLEKELSNNGRIDMAILDPNESLKFAVEMKCSYYKNDTYFADIDRLSALLKNYKKSSDSERALQSSILALFVSEKSMEKDGLEQSLKEKCEEWSVIFQDYIKDNHDYITTNISYGKHFYSCCDVEDEKWHTYSTSMCILLKYK